MPGSSGRFISYLGLQPLQKQGKSGLHLVEIKCDNGYRVTIPYLSCIHVELEVGVHILAGKAFDLCE
ncbi:hypothetical protein IC620_16030 [Hazenella sp. IB182357]|uniref:Uncharacterized protein n=1 Tax=Polycladospora coralii TaxID=2771432 RepID=A0A926NHW7_9BACL|nr:hypothetical protein [Polycladospora coralii]MBD1373854.1 hypothetical protein [Polycladospora coralii]